MIRVRGSNQQKKQLFHHDLGLKGCLDKETFFSGSVDTYIYICIFYLFEMTLDIGEVCVSMSKGFAYQDL